MNAASIYGYVIHVPATIQLDSLNVLQADYYDTYDYRNYLSGFVSSLNYIADENYGKLYEDNCEVPLHCKGLLTGSMTTTLGVDQKLYGCYYYDYNRNLIQERHTMLNGEIASYRYSYDFSGQPVKSAESYGSEIEFKRVYFYDHVGRLLEEKHVLKNDTTRFVYDYDALGRVKSLVRIHDKDSLSTENEYNIRNWLTAICNPHFTQELHYTDGAGTACYNGNISSMMWKQSSDVESRGYNFEYDDLNRFKDAVYGEGVDLCVHPNRFNEQVTGYDKMGNILGLLRYGETKNGDYGLLDNLHLSYGGNRLLSVYDNATLSSSSTGMEFVDRADSLVEYAYDANGNLTKDLNKKIADIQYNVLNLPCQIAFENGNSISYTYSGDGRKLRTTHVINGTAFTTDYCGNAIYENDVPMLLLTEYGYITLSDMVYHYFIQDHQGNNRVVVDQNGTVEEVNHYYPFGGGFAHDGDVQPYKYNGKELDRKNGLDWYDYGARYYDAVLGRWHVIDPLAENYYSLNPYCYCGLNPVIYIDPFGMDYWSTNDQNEIAQFMHVINSFPSASSNLFETIDFSSWNHSTDGEFLSNLTFNDQTNMFYSSYGTFEDGVLTSVGVSFTALQNNGREAIIEGVGSKWYKKSSGRLENLYPEYKLIRFVQSLYVNPFSFVGRSIGELSGFKAHSKGKNWQKHSAPRSGGDPEKGRYGQSQNKKKGSKNQKYIVPNNPNKRPK